MEYRVCTKCNETFEATTENFYKRKHGKFGLCSICKGCIKEYHKHYNLPGGKRIEVFCKECKKSFYTSPSLKYKKKFCSKACYDKWQIGKRTGENSAVWKKKIINNCLNCGKEMHVIPALAERKKFCSKQCMGVWLYEKNGIMTKPEKILNYVLLSHGINVETHKTIGKHNVDFWIKDTNIAIEVDGYYWHVIKREKAKDQIKDAALSKLGYIVIRIPEMDIYDNIKKCIDAIKSKLGGD